MGDDIVTIPNLCARRVAVAALRRPDEHPWTMDVTFDVLEAWLRATGSVVVHRVWQRRRAPDPATYLGQGKARQMRALCDRDGVEALVLDGTLRLSQRTALERVLARPVWDRTVWAPAPSVPAGMGRAREVSWTARRRRGAVSVALCGAAGAGKSTLFAALTGGPALRPSWPPRAGYGPPLVVTRRLRSGSMNGLVLVTDTPGIVGQPESGTWRVPDETRDACRHADLVLHVIDASHPEARRRSRDTAAVLGPVAPGRMMAVWTQVDRAPRLFDKATGDWIVSGRTRNGCDRLAERLARLARGTTDCPDASSGLDCL